MRHIPLPDVLQKLLDDPSSTRFRARLSASQLKVAKMLPGLRNGYIRRNGPRKWSPVKVWFTKKLGKKCWYTEAETVGAPLTIDHYRPISKYWWLAFTVENYRVACAFANSPEHNLLHGCAGGKGDAFPLLPPARRAVSRLRNRPERPVILDPCSKSDCEMVAFEADGRPVIDPRWASDRIARKRFQESLILLNLDHPDFNTKREQLGNDIKVDVKTVEALPLGCEVRTCNIDRLKSRLGKDAPFSSAARHYLQFYRHLPWVEELLAKSK